MKVEAGNPSLMIGSVEEGALALWGCVLERAMQDVAHGIRTGQLGEDLTVTDKRGLEDGFLPGQALQFLRGREGALVCDLVRSAAGGRNNINPGFLLKQAVRLSRSPSSDTWVNRRPQRTPQEEAQRAEARRQSKRDYQKVYQRERKSKRRAAALETPANPEQKECA